MNRSLLISLFFLFLNTSVYCQQKVTAEFGKPDSYELQLTSYPKDPDAAGVVLFEKGKNYVKLVENNSYIKLIKEVHRKIKVIDAKNFEESVVYIPYYQSGNDREKVTSIKAITHNGALQMFVNSADIYETKETENWYYKRFTFPNVKDGSILEYSYVIESPFYFNFGTWEFQGNMPKVYSEFVSEMPGNYVYKKSLIGYESLYINEVSLLENCFSLPGHVQNADCEVATYAMQDIPAFKEEDHMLSSSNYRAGVKFELVEFTNFKGIKTKYTKEWRDVDKQFRTDKDMGGQLKFENFFEEQIPSKIRSIPDDLERAKAVYYFIQQHFNWNGKYNMAQVRVKDAFEEGGANNSEINLALVNALNAANIDSHMVLLSTRSHGLPTQLYPVLTDFNHVIAAVNINGTNHLLDATSKEAPFGILPFADLNGQGRLMDFKEGSSWIPIEPYARNTWYISGQFKIDENNLLIGEVAETFTGYKAMEKRTILKQKTKNDYLKSWEKSNMELEVADYQHENKNDLEQNLKEIYQAKLELPEANQLFLYPFFLRKSFDENPFKLAERSYPVDFGHATNETFLISIDLNNQYEITELPENKIIKIPGGAGECSVIYGGANGELTLRYSYKLNHHYFEAEAYNSLKEFFANVVSLQNKEVVVLSKL